jgi:hypothetical protein
MKKLNALSLGKSLNREEMKKIKGGIEFIDGGDDSVRKCGYCNSPYDCGSGCDGCDKNQCYKIKW